MTVTKRAQPSLRLYVVVGVLSATLAIIVALIVVLVATPIYRAQTSVSVRPRIADLGAAEAAARLVKNYAAWVDSEAYAARLTSEQRAGLSLAEVARNVRTNGDAERLLVTIQAEDFNAARAAVTVNELAALLVTELETPERIDDPQRGLEIRVIDAAHIPTSPIWPQAIVALPMAGILGGILGSASIWIVSPISRTSRG
jgi:capsular polysaccharide biosynthesis protein